MACALLLATGCTSQGSGSDAESSAPSRAASQQSQKVAPVPVVARRDFQISYELSGATERSLQVSISLPPGFVWRTHDDGGTEVSAGDKIGQQNVDPSFRAALAASAKTSRVDAARLANLDDEPHVVAAPIGGVVKVSESGDVSIAAPGVDVVVPITGIQQLRISAVPIDGAATVETVVGQRRVACSFLWVGDPPTDTEGIDAAGSLRCRLPRIVETAPNLRATLHVTSRVIKDATVVPDVMLGQDATGYTITIVRDGKKTTIPVEVGPSDGVVRVITSDLPIGATIVEPGQ